jgi:serine protease Do
MTEHKNPLSTTQAVVALVIAVGVSSLFGFLGGMVGANRELSSTLLSSFSPKLGERYLAALDAPAAPTPPKPPALPQSEEEMTVAAVETASPAVVSIVVAKDMPVYEQYNANPFGNDDFFQQFFGDNPAFQMPQVRQKGTEKKDIGAGTGFIVTEDGYIVTNRHVVIDEAAEYTVVLQDGSKHDAKVIGRDPSNDIAVLKIEGTGLSHLAFGDSDAIKVGQRVIAIGYALGQFGNSVSTGVVSGLKRSIQASNGMTKPEDLYDVIQTDTAINPGNSGGPLLNLKGEVIGVNVAIVQGSQNIGFALPANDVKRVIETVKTGGKISRAWLGVRYVMVNKDIKKQNQLSVDYGALVVRGDQQTDLAVPPGSPADLAGIEENDIILEAGGKKLTEEYPLALAIRGFGPGDKVTLKVLHKGKEKTVDVTLAERK